MNVSRETRNSRIKKTAEIFTPELTVNEILDNFDVNCWHSERIFCDPSAGNGNFLIEILSL